MRRPLALALLGATALSSLALAPVADDADGPLICVRYRDTDVPGTGITIPTPLPGDRFCIGVNVPGADA